MSTSYGLSSPLRDSNSGAVIPTAEMARRMLKRSRQGDSFSSRDQEQGSGQERERSTKRSKNTAINLHLFDPYTSDVFQTPYGEEYIHPSAVTKQLIPEELSPLPILNRASSRNPKENASRYSSTKGLASPFSSRHNSAGSSPRSRPRKKIQSNSKSKPRRPASATKLRSTYSGSSHHSLFHDGATLSVDQDMPKSAVTTKLRALNRYQSSHTLTQNSRQDWLVPPQALKRKLQVSDNIRTPHYGSEISSSYFMLDFSAFSTPFPSPDQSPPVFVAPANDVSSFSTALDDVTMVPILNSTPESPHKNDVKSLPSFSVLAAPECDSSTPLLDSLFEPMGIQLDEITFNNHAPIDDENSSENQKEDALNSLFDELVLDPADDGAFPVFVLGVVSCSSYFRWRHLRVMAFACWDNRAPSNNKRGQRSSSFHLGLRTSLKSTFSNPIRTKSLNSDSSILSFPLPPASTSGRKRAGTIRASDYQPAAASHALARRTRSGTIVGPTSMSAMKVPTPISRKTPIHVPRKNRAQNPMTSWS